MNGHASTKDLGKDTDPRLTGSVSVQVAFRRIGVLFLPSAPYLVRTLTACSKGPMAETKTT